MCCFQSVSCSEVPTEKADCSEKLVLRPIIYGRSSREQTYCKGGERHLIARLFCRKRDETPDHRAKPHRDEIYLSTKRIIFLPIVEKSSGKSCINKFYDNIFMSVILCAAPCPFII